MKIVESQNFKESRLNNWASLLFRLGIVASSALVAIGLIILITIYGTEGIQPLVRLDQIPAAIAISVGILVLLLTPIIQVIVAIVFFSIAKNRLFLGISVAVLFFAAIGLILGLI